MGDVTYINGLLLPSEEAVVSAEDAGFLYGDGLFETMRAYSGRVFMLDAHLRRLLAGAKAIGLDDPPPIERLIMVVEATIWANYDPDTVVRITLTRGAPNAKTKTLVVQTRPLAYTPEDYSKGAKCITHPDLRSRFTNVKSLNYLPNVLARREAAMRGCLETFLYDCNGFMTEGSMSNIFVVSDGVIRTPSLDYGILNGITRSVVVKIAKKAGLEVHVEAVRLDSVFQAHEVFITNSVMEIMPVISIDGKKIGSGLPGILTETLLDSYRSLTALTSRTE